ncbi:hypothetical protein C2S53_019388 [Perilla frutescens var. hirtella]|uniref:Uncharacterized protein n=1 Tax=Perilla frutescens var. hirtella TaxID=608512 RepID=A0AAD4JMH8_PERFH|nr:hypothetical protein C2S53_019388 [Perilla frutescens var. hirtella]
MAETWAPKWKPLTECPQFLYRMIHLYIDDWKLEQYDEVEDSAYYPNEECVPGSMECHQTLKRFLKQVRHSRGYDVDCYPPEIAESVFLPTLNLARWMQFEDYRDDVMKSTHFAIEQINAEAQKFGKRYELKDVEKVVNTTNLMTLLTFTVKDADADAGDIVKTIQAMVYTPAGKDLELVEWRFKPVAAAELLDSAQEGSDSPESL